MSFHTTKNTSVSSSGRHSNRPCRNTPSEAVSTGRSYANRIMSQRIGEKKDQTNTTDEISNNCLLKRKKQASYSLPNEKKVVLLHS